jgi:dTDP-glucose 4,6-dehydratase
VIEAGRPGESYNLGGDCERTNLELVRVLCALVDRRLGEEPELLERFPRSLPAQGERCENAITFVRDRPGHDRRYAIDASRARAELGFRPRHDLESGLEATLDWYLENESWWRGLQQRSDYRSWIDRQYGAAGAAKGE